MVTNICQTCKFFSWNGGAMISGDISKRLHKLWFNAGNFQDRLIPKNRSCTIVRKSTSTGIYTQVIRGSTSRFDGSQLENSKVIIFYGSKKHIELLQVKSRGNIIWNEEEITELLHSVFCTIDL